MKIVFIIISLFLTACTISLQNISTKGTATDIVDQEQQASPDVKTTVPVSGLP